MRACVRACADRMLCSQSLCACQTYFHDCAQCTRTNTHRERHNTTYGHKIRFDHSRWLYDLIFHLHYTYVLLCFTLLFSPSSYVVASLRLSLFTRQRVCVCVYSFSSHISMYISENFHSDKNNKLLGVLSSGLESVNVTRCKITVSKMHTCVKEKTHREPQNDECFLFAWMFNGTKINSCLNVLIWATPRTETLRLFAIFFAHDWLTFQWKLMISSMHRKICSRL